jgi:hypothetical protein
MKPIDLSNFADQLRKLTENETLTKSERKVISALVEAIVSMKDELIGMSTETSDYKDLCRQSQFFSTLQKVLTFGNQLIHYWNLERKNALRQCTRTSKKTKSDKLTTEISKLSKEERVQLIQKLTTLEEEG